MSLKAFHIFFISVSVLLCWGFGWWCLNSDTTRGQIGYTIGGWVSLLLGVGLIAYEVGFLRKFKENK